MLGTVSSTVAFYLEVIKNARCPVDISRRNLVLFVTFWSLTRLFDRELGSRILKLNQKDKSYV